MADFSLLLKKTPSGWKEFRLCDICIRVQNNYHPDPNGTRLYLGLEHLAQGLPMLVGRGSETDVKSSKNSFRPNDVLFGKLRPYLRKCVLLQEEGVCSTDILVFRANDNILPQYLCYLCNTDQFVGHAKVTTSGVQHPRTSWNSLSGFRLTLPPIAEQRRITNVLAIIQTAIEQQVRLIKLMHELKSALMHKLFTEGLRGEKQKMTEIGPVPESWEVVPLQNVARDGFQNGAFIKNPSIGKGILFANVVDMYSDVHLGFGNLERIDVEISKIKQYLLQENDVLVVRSSLKREGIGQNSVVKNLTEPVFFDCHLIRVKPDATRIVPEFLSYFWRSDKGKQDLIQRSKTTTMTTINQATLAGALMPVPSYEEQGEIANILLTTDAKIQAHRLKQKKLEELFRTLLHQLMTGQTRVNDIDLPGFK
jgi:type I restriction enzyme S subunit